MARAIARRHAAGVHRQSEQSHRHLGRTRRRCKRLHRGRAPRTRWWCSTRPTSNSRAERCAQDGLPWLRGSSRIWSCCAPSPRRYGLAGLRVGYAVSHPEVADAAEPRAPGVQCQQRRRRPPRWPRSATRRTCSRAAQRIVRERGRVRRGAARARAVDVAPSAGNFLLVEAGARGARGVYEQLLRGGVIVRPDRRLRTAAAPAHLDRHCREQNDRLLAAAACRSCRPAEHESLSQWATRRNAQYKVSPAAHVRRRAARAGRQVHLASRADARRHRRRAKRGSSGFLDERRLPRDLAALRALGVQHRAARASHEVIVQGAGARGLQASAAPLDMGNAGTAMRLFMGLLCRPEVRQHADRRRFADAAADGARRETAAADGRAHRYAGWPATGASCTAARSCTASTTRCRWPARRSNPRCCWRGSYAAGHDPRDRAGAHPRSHRTHARRLWRQRARADGATRASSPAARACAAREIRVPGDFSSAAFFIVAGCLAATRWPDGAGRRHQPDAHRPARHAAADGCAHRCQGTARTR